MFCALSHIPEISTAEPDHPENSFSCTERLPIGYSMDAVPHFDGLKIGVAKDSDLSPALTNDDPTSGNTVQ